MPLRFRSVVPYTLPGILALIGWWWYISRKKERITSPESTERFPVIESSLTSPTEGSNGLDERGTVSPQNDTTASGHQKGRKGGPQKVKNQQLAKQEVIALVHIPGLDSSPTHKETSVVAALYSGTVRADCEKINTPPTLAMLSSNDNVTPDSQATECGRMAQERRLVPVFSSVIKHEEEVKVSSQESYLNASVSSCQSAQVNHAYTTEADHAKVERPEPEGEVASVAAPCVGQPVPDHHTMVINKDEMVSKGPTATNKSSATPNKDSVEINTSLQGFYQHVRTSTPISAALAQGTASTPTNSSEGSIVYLRQQVSNTDDKEQELEILAAGLITEVISAATQEVLGVTSCQDTDNRQPGGSSTTNTPLTNGRLFSQQEPLVVVNRHLLIEEPSPIDCDFRAANLSEGDKQGVLNGFSSTVIWEPSEVSHREKATENTLRGHRPVGSHPTAQVAQLPNLATLKTAERVTLAEDCNSCHLEGAINKDGLHNSRPEHQVDLFRVLDMSRGEPTLPQQSDQTVTEAAVLAFAGGNTLDAVCAMKRLNGIGLKNDSHGMGEVDTDQSGGSDVNSMDSVDSGCTMGALDNQSPHAAGSSSELIIWEIEVPKHLVGRLIGKQGRYVSFLKQNSAAKIYISTLPYTQEFQICHIEGAQQQVDKALSLIGKKFKDLDLTNLYASPPPPLTLPSLPMTSWLLLPSGVTVEVIVVNIVSAGHVFVQQHTHPTYHALRSLDQQMFLCYSQPGTPALPSPAEVGVICAAPAVEGAWWRAQVITFYKENNEVEIRYVDYGGYDRVKIDSLRQIRSDFVTLPFQGAEVLLDSIAPLPGEERFSSDANLALEDVTRGVALLAQVSNYDNNTGLPLVQLWNMVGDELVSVNRTLAERGFGAWVDSF